MSTDNLSILVGAVSTIAALISIFFAWRAVKVAEKSNTIGLISEIQKQRWSESIFNSLRIVWKQYHVYQENAEEGEPITFEQAWNFVAEYQQKEGSEEWKAVHELIGFWHYIAVLVKRGFLDEEIVTSAIGSPRVLGFLYPIEEAFAEYNTKTYVPSVSLKWYYELWKTKKKSRPHKRHLITRPENTPAVD